jgi:PAS domain S-box-containing protein
MNQQRKVPNASVPKKKSDGLDIHLELSDVLEALPFYAMLLDENHNILKANKAVRSQLGVEPKDIIGKYCPMVIHGLDKPVDNCPLEEAVERNQSIEREILDPGSLRWVRSAVYPIGRTTVDGRRIFFHMVTDITDRKKAEEKLIVANEQLRDLSQHLESIREEERTYLAREIHDEFGQILTGLKIDVSWIARNFATRGKPLLEKIKVMNQLIDEALQIAKRISSELRPGVLDHLGLAAAIEWQAKELEKRTETRFEFKSSPRNIAVDRGRSTAIFRICQEALTNIVRHANASRVKIDLRGKPGWITLSIADNGKGIEESQLSDPKSFGLIGIRERARFWGGDVNIIGSPGKGTVLNLVVPLMKE